MNRKSVKKNSPEAKANIDQESIERATETIQPISPTS